MKFDERIENAMNAFFETRPDRSHFAMTYTGQTASLVADQAPFTEKTAILVGTVVRAIMFGAGTLALFFGTLMAAFFYGTPGLSFGFEWGLRYLFVVLLTYAGCGGIKNLKNLAVPAAVIAMSLAIVLIPELLLGKEISGGYFGASIYLFPFVLIAAKLVQGWVSDKE